MDELQSEDWVYLKCFPQKHKSITKKDMRKFHAKYFGPYPWTYIFNQSSISHGCE